MVNNNAAKSVRMNTTNSVTILQQKQQQWYSKIGNNCYTIRQK